LVFLKKRIIPTIFIIFLLCNLLTSFYLKKNSQKNTDIARTAASSGSLITSDGEYYIYENVTFTDFTFSGNATYLFKNCSFDCDNLDFGPSVNVTFQNCTILTNKFHTGQFSRATVPTNYTAEINLILSNLTFKQAPPSEVLHHTDFVFLGNSIVRIENTTIYAPLRQLEPHEDTKLFILNSFLNLNSIQIFERASVLLENSRVETNATSIGDFYDITPPHNASLLINNSQLSGVIWNFSLNSTVTIQNSSVELLVKTIWVGESIYLNGGEIISGSGFGVSDFIIDGKSHWEESQYLLIGMRNTIIEVESSVIYGLACNDSKAYVYDSIITDFISGVSFTPQIFIMNSIFLGKGYIGKSWGVISPFPGLMIFNKFAHLPQSAFLTLKNCTINGTIYAVTETIILQDCHFLLGQWNNTIIACSNGYIIVLIETKASQYLLGNTSIDILMGTAYQIAETTFSINDMFINETEILNRLVYSFNAFSGMGPLIPQPYLHYTYDFSTICGPVNFSIVFTSGSENYTRNFTLDFMNSLCYNDNLSWFEILLILSFWVLIGLLIVTAVQMKISQARKQNRQPSGNSSPRDHIADP